MKLLLFISFLFCWTAIFSQDIVINEFMSDNNQTIADEDGDFVDWIELYNNSNTTINLHGLKLSDDPDNLDKWVFPSVFIAPNGFLIIFASGKDRTNSDPLHTNFKIKASGEPIILSNQDNVKIDSLPAIPLEPDKSYGRLDDGTENLGYFMNPTPNYSNNGQQFEKEIMISRTPGFYTGPFYLKLSCEDSVYFTLDGSNPTVKSKLFTDTILISSSLPNKLSLIPTTSINYDPDLWPNNEFGFRAPQYNLNKARVLRMQSFKNGVKTSKIYNATYFTNDRNYTFPVISLITDSLNLFNHDSGIYIPGVHLVSNNLHWTGNYYQRGEDWERSGNIELFNSSGELEFSKEIGFRISGQASRSAPQKSIRIYFEDEFGSSGINYPFFPDRDYSNYERLILRSSFTYWWGKNSLFQDDFLQTAVSQSEFNVDLQMTLPSVLFINGEYWGIHNIRERQDKYYLQSIYGIDKDSVDIIEGNMTVIEGSAETFIYLMEFVELNDLSITSNYEFVKANIDIHNYIDYFIIQTYFGNYDWPHNNIKMWKMQRTNSKWKWLLFDLDATINDVSFNPFNHINNSSGTQVLLFNSLLQNEEFKSEFVQRYAYHLQNSFNPGIINSQLDQFISKYSPEVSEHIYRWGNPSDYYTWIKSCDHIREFIENRPCYMKEILIEQFELHDLSFDCFYNLPHENAINIYPNPSAGNITIVFNDKTGEPKEIRIINVMGQIIYQNDTDNLIHHLDLSFLKNGVYFIQILGSNSNKTEKLLIRK